MLLKRIVSVGGALVAALLLFTQHTTAAAFAQISVVAKHSDHDASPPRTPTIAEHSDHDAGINCRGSSNCLAYKGRIAFIKEYIDDIDEGWRYQNGEYIACYSYGTQSMCAFLQNTPRGATGSEIKKPLMFLIDHTCEGCGSAPLLLLDGMNDGSQGELTVNAVWDTRGCNTTCLIGT